MRKLNRLAALLLAVVMVLGLTGTAFASENGGYTDVPDWAAEYVDTVTELGLIDGKSAATFAPDENMSRVDLVTALYRLGGSPAGTAENPFTDLDGLTDEQKSAIAWAAAEKIVNGTNDAGTTFEPNGSVERQAIAKILNLFAAWKVKASALTSSKNVVSSFPDAAKVADWAADPMNWIVASEFMQGNDAGLLDPTGTATRAQVAVILCRYLADDTGDASKDKPRNEDNIGENELLVVSFGTSFNDNRVATIGAIEDAMEKAFADYSVRRGFTADIIIEHVLRRDGEKIDSVKEALDRAVSNGVKNLLVQPTHLMNGYEYGDLRSLLEKKYADKFESIRIGAPLLTSDEDFKAVAEAMVRATEGAVLDDKTAVCWMGHGTSADSNNIYAQMKTVLDAAGYTNYFVGTVESEPTAEDLVKLVKEGGYEKVILRPMMIVAGDHANNDMADPADPESWYSVFSAAGLDVTCQVNGLGEIAEIQQLLVEHAKSAELLSETKIVSQPNPENPDNEEEPAQPEETKPAEETKALADGTYTIDVETDGGMFKVIAGELTVKDGKMTAVITMSGTGFSKVYMGTAEEAMADAEGAIAFQMDEAGEHHTFEVPVAALDTELACAAIGSKETSKWNDHSLTFDSSTAVAK